MSYPCHHCDFVGNTYTETHKHIVNTHRVVRRYDEDGKMYREVV